MSDSKVVQSYDSFIKAANESLEFDIKCHKEGAEYGLFNEAELAKLMDSINTRRSQIEELEKRRNELQSEGLGL